MATIAGFSIYYETKWSIGTRPPPARVSVH
jgi:hypothetical protein